MKFQIWSQKTFAFRVTLLCSLVLTGTGVSQASADDLFPCGGTAKYEVLQPRGLAWHGYYCSGDLILDSSVKIVDQMTFMNTNLNSIIIPDSVTLIDSSAFRNSKLTSVIFGNGLTEIRSNAFLGNQLTIVDVPDSVKFVGKNAFADNPKLTKIIRCGVHKDIYGVLESLPIPPTCPPGRQAVLDKAAADKAAADKAAADKAEFQNSQKNIKMTITCLKGKVSKKVTGDPPKCPTGYSNPAANFLTYKAYSQCKLYKKKDFMPLPITLWSVNGDYVLDFEHFGKYSDDYFPQGANMADLECALKTMKVSSAGINKILRLLDGNLSPSIGFTSNTKLAGKVSVQYRREFDNENSLADPFSGGVSIRFTEWK